MAFLFLILISDRDPSLMLMSSKSEWIGVVKAESSGFAVIETIKGSPPNWSELGPVPDWAKGLKDSEQPLLIIVGEEEMGMSILALFEIRAQKALVPENVSTLGNIRKNGTVDLDWFRFQALPMPNELNMPNRKSIDLSAVSSYVQEHGCEGHHMAAFECRINPEGQIDQVYWIRYWDCLDPKYEKLIEDSLKKTLYEPFLVQGQPSAFRFTIGINHFAPCGCD